MDEKPIVAATSQGAFKSFAKRDYDIRELGFLKSRKLENGELVQNGVGKALTEVLDLARQGQRVVLVSREDRKMMDEDAAKWFFKHFAVVHVVDKPRYDHRRFRAIVYEYRPSPQ